jgi:putative ABC transport system ATP-binding protein
MSILRCEALTRTYPSGGREITVLRDITFELDAGRILAITGPSGSGKSTLLGLLAGLDRPTRGRVLMDGRDLAALDEDERARLRAESVGFVFQSFHLIPRLSAAANIELPLLLAGVSPEERASRVGRLIADYGLTGRESHRPDQLSGGQRQRVAIARATVMEPAVILADEPTGNLDRTTGQDVMALLEGLTERGVALVLVTHDPEIGRRAPRKVQMVDGRITSDQGPRS